MLAEIARLNLGVNGSVTDYYQLLISEMKALGIEGRTTAEILD